MQYSENCKKESGNQKEIKTQNNAFNSQSELVPFRTSTSLSKKSVAGNCFKMQRSNIRSLSCDFMKLCSYVYEEQPDIICLSETFKII